MHNGEGTWGCSTGAQHTHAVNGHMYKGGGAGLETNLFVAGAQWERADVTPVVAGPRLQGFIRGKRIFTDDRLVVECLSHSFDEDVPGELALACPDRSSAVLVEVQTLRPVMAAQEEHAHRQTPFPVGQARIGVWVDAEVDVPRDALIEHAADEARHVIHIPPGIPHNAYLLDFFFGDVQGFLVFLVGAKGNGRDGICPVTSTHALHVT